MNSWIQNLTFEGVERDMKLRVLGVLASPGRTRFGGMKRRFDCGPNTLHRYWFVVQQTLRRTLYSGTCSNKLKFVDFNMILFQQFHKRLSSKTDQCPLSIQIFQSSSTGACTGSGQYRRNEQTEKVWAVYASLILIRRATNTIRRAHLCGWIRTVSTVVSKHCINSKTGRRQWQWHTRVRSSNRCQGMARMLWWRLRKKNKLSDIGALLDQKVKKKKTKHWHTAPRNHFRSGLSLAHANLIFWTCRWRRLLPQNSNPICATRRLTRPCACWAPAIWDPPTLGAFQKITKKIPYGSASRVREELSFLARCSQSDGLHWHLYHDNGEHLCGWIRVVSKSFRQAPPVGTLERQRTGSPGNISNRRTPWESHPNSPKKITQRNIAAESSPKDRANSKTDAQLGVTDDRKQTTPRHLTVESSERVTNEKSMC